MAPIALIITDLTNGRLGHARSVLDVLDGRSVLEHTLRRAARIEGLSQLVLVHPGDQDINAAVAGLDVGKPIVAFADPGGLADAHTPARLSARKWALTSWRGGFGGATCYDELLPAEPLAAAMREHGAEAAAIVGADWCCFDPSLASHQLERHIEAPEAMKLTFTQAPPGLGAICTSLAVLEEFAQHGAGFHNALWYNPKKPTIDPIGKEVCLPIPAEARDTFERFIYDTPGGRDALKSVTKELGERLVDADLSEITANAQSSAIRHPPSTIHHLTLELTPRREAAGLVTAQHHATLDRADMATDLAVDLVRQAAVSGDMTLMLGHLGEPTLHAEWDHIIEAADEAGCSAIGIETDLLCDEAMLGRLAELPLDVVVVRINADTAATYEKVMGLNGFPRVARNLQKLFELKQQRGGERARRFHAGLGEASTPRGFWIIPKLVKVRDNVREIESFFDRWVTIAGHALVDRFDTGGGVAPDLSPVPMDPPVRLPTPMDGKCAFVLSNGLVTADRNDWSGGNALGHASSLPLQEIWQRRVRFAEAV